MKTSYKKILLILSFCLLLTPAIVWGQSTNLDTQSLLDSYNQMNVVITPQTPKSGDLVQATVSAPGWDFNQAKITWYINGEKLASDYGLKNVSFNLGKSSTILEVSVLGADGRKGTGKINIKPNDVVVFWEASTYTPPFYRGKALAPAGTIFRVVAIPNVKNSSGVKVSPDKLVYKWKKNDQLSVAYSGYGKNVFYTVDETYLRDGNTIDAEIYTTDSSADYQTTLYVPHQEAAVLLYEIDPLLGRLYNTAMAAYITYSSEFLKLIAEPYFFSNVTGNQELQFAWTVKGEAIDFTKPIVELKSADGLTFDLGLTVTHTTKILQSATFKTNITPKQVTSLQTNTF